MRAPAPFNMQDIDRNELILGVVCKENPTRVPSSFYLADALLVLDDAYSRKLYDGKNRKEAALLDAHKIKTLVSYLRGLWRDTKSSRTLGLRECAMIVESQTCMQATLLNGVLSLCVRAPA